MKRIFIATALLTSTLFGTAMARADTFPDRPIHLVVPFSPGGSTDLVGRLVGAKVAQILGQSVIVENRAGAGGSIGSAYVARSAPDGYTLLMATTSHTANPALYKSLPYDTQKDFAPISLLCDMPGLLVAHPSLPPNNFKEFISYAKTHKLDYGSAGVGTFPHLSMEMLKSRAGLQMTHVPYKGAAPALADLVRGVYQVKVDAYITANSFVQSGKLKLYAVTSAQRMEQLPNVPTVAESGYPGFESTYWIGIVVPSATPAPIRAKLEKAFMQAIHDKDVSAKLIATGTRPIGSTAAVLGQRITRELAQWPVILRNAGIKAQ
ncbi:tripartite tricarboxylate transporter substrate binding protein [Candidimonas humi]|uniref:Bug family tripartite tricarboxylate transporter substrate binding protein n=1 Tax=Candidimonas humi TaxID=683355 RepID=A0ABV8NUS1_9BURK|nr:tripartite tricarboxylate transporter substrate binding protein [Candidimonas humi]MBV6303526.1 tripartite tricarboxylate transporter substrate binding protein [Candidimonas humi]